GAAETLGDGTLVIGTHTLAGFKDLVGWLPQARRFVTYGGTSTITLERNALPASNSNYLIGMIPFGTNGQYYTVELRQKAGLDHRIERQCHDPERRRCHRRSNASSGADDGRRGQHGQQGLGDDAHRRPRRIGHRVDGERRSSLRWPGRSRRAEHLAAGDDAHR